MKHEKPPSLPPAAFPLPPSSWHVHLLHHSPISSLLLFPTPSESLRIPLSVPTVPTSNFECITGPPLNLPLLPPTPLSLPVSGQMEI